jgi:hypothetical protein
VEVHPLFNEQTSFLDFVVIPVPVNIQQEKERVDHNNENKRDIQCVRVIILVVIIVIEICPQKQRASDHPIDCVIKSLFIYNKSLNLSAVIVNKRCLLVLCELWTNYRLVIMIIHSRKSRWHFYYK